MTAPVQQRPPGIAAAPDSSPPIWLARGCGVVAGLVGLAVADLLARFVSLPGAPIPAVGTWLISLFPAPVIEFGKSTLGTADKPVLLVGIAVVSLLVAAFAGQLELRRRRSGLAVFGLLAVFAALGVHAQAEATLVSYLPPLVGLGLGYVVLNALVVRLARTPATSSPERRRFLRTLVLGGAVASVTFAVGRSVQAGAAAVGAARARVRLPAPLHRVQDLPAAGTDLGLPGLTPYITANTDFYRIDTALSVPRVDPDSWSLKVTGLVEHEITLSFAELLAQPLTEHLVTLTCVSNVVGGDLAGTARWLGWPVRELLARARPQPGADMVLSTSVDGFSAGTPLDALTDPHRLALLAVGMNGEPLPTEHGFPVRMVVPGLYGYVSATKWVSELKVTTFAADQGYWTPLGWSARGPIKLASRIDVPQHKVDAGTVVVAGVAWCQHVGVAGVAVRVDDGPWLPATLAPTAGPDTWRQWSYPWAATPGRHTLTVRATDAEGHVQTATLAPPEPDGATGYHSVSVTVR